MQEQHIVTAFDRDLEAIQSNIMKMGGLVEAAMTGSATALDDRDVDLAEQVRADDKKIDALEVLINEDCARLIALRAPMASDLRTVFELRPCCRTLGYFTPVRERGTKWDNIDAIIQTIIRQLQLSGYMSLVRRKAALPRNLGSLGRS